MQGCTSEKEAWDILQVSFEGISNMKRCMIDVLESEFENLTMGVRDKFTKMLRIQGLWLYKG